MEARSRCFGSAPAIQIRWTANECPTRQYIAVLLVQNRSQQCLVDLNFTVVVFDEAEISKFVHEEIHPRARSADYFRQSLLGNSWQFVVRPVLHFSITAEYD